MKPTFAIITERKSLADVAYEKLLDSIVSGRVKPGSRLNEAHIALELGVSRAPVREAIQRLRQDGMVINSNGRSPQVMRLTLAQVREVFEVRVALELVAIELVMSHKSKTIVESLDLCVQTMRALASQRRLGKLVAEEMRFHEMIVEGSGNNMLMEMYLLILNRLRMILSVDKQQFTELQDVAESHTTLVNAIQDGELSNARKILKEHIWSAFPEIEAHPAFSSATIQDQDLSAEA